MFHKFCISYSRERVGRSTLPILEENRQRKGLPGRVDPWTPLAAECSQGRNRRKQPSRSEAAEVIENGKVDGDSCAWLGG